MPKALPLGELAGASPTERARMLTEKRKPSDSIALAYQKAQKSPLGGSDSEGAFLFGVTILAFDIPDFRIPDSPQKSSAVQKVYSHSSPDIYCIFLPKFMV